MTNDKFEARYQVDDGYAGSARPKYFKISPDELEEDFSNDDLRDFYHAAVQEDFEQKISPCAERVDQFIAWAKEQLAKRGQE